MERLKRKLGDGVPAALVFPSEDVENLPFESISTNTPSVISRSRPTPNATDGSSSKLLGSAPKSSFSLERPLFAIVEGSDDHVSSCFDFGSRRERVAVPREHGRRRT
jgi:hypothetical protein